MDREYIRIKNILLIEDDALDVELTLTALEAHHLANMFWAVVNEPPLPAGSGSNPQDPPWMRLKVNHV